MRYVMTPFSFADPFHSASSRSAAPSQRAQVPHRGIPTTIYEHESHVVIALDVPGFTDADLEITVNNGELHVTGKRSAELPAGAKVVFNSRQTDAVERFVKLDESLDPNSVAPVLESGVLKIQLSRMPQPQATPIRIRSAT